MPQHIAVIPDDLGARTGRAAAHVQAGRHAEARAELAAALQACGDLAALWWRMAFVESALGDAVQALACLERAVRAGPAEAEDWYRVGWLYLEYWRYEEATSALATAARMAPARADVLRMLAYAEQQAANDEGALAHLQAAREAAPGDMPAEVAHALYLPLIADSQAAAVAWRERYAQGLARLHEEGLPRWRRCASAVFALGQENFLLAYQAEDDRELQRLYSGFLATLAGQARPEWREPRRLAWDGRRRLRVGFVGSIFRDCTAGRYFERWITGLDAARFERLVYHTAPLADAITERIAAGSDGFVSLRASTEDLAARLAADGLDILVHPEVGMTPASYLLAALRLAPLQLAGWGHPVTTGSDAIDGYLTSEAMEPPDGASHYVERLLRLPGLGVDYAMPAPVAAFAREDLRLPATGAVYACPQSLFKIHPRMDVHFARLLGRDPGATLLFFQGQSRGATQRFAARLQAAMAAQGIEPRRQVKFLPRMPGDAFRRVLAACDVVLDTFGWSGGNTSLDALSVATPVVTWPGRFMRGRQTAAMLRTIGAEALVASSEDDWLERANGIARDPARRREMQRLIVEGRGALFGRPEPTRALEEILLRLAAEMAG